MTEKAYFNTETLGQSRGHSRDIENGALNYLCNNSLYNIPVKVKVTIY